MSALRTSTSAPTRAITTAILSRSSPEVPPASQTYEPPLKAVLRHRLIYRIFPYSALFSWIFAVALCTDGYSLLDALASLFRPRTFLLAVVHWAVAALPVIVMRKTLLTVSPSIATSPQKTFQKALTQLSIRRALYVYASAGVALATMYALLSDNSVNMGAFIRSRRHPYYLNGRPLVLIISQLALSLIFTLRLSLQDRLLLRFASSSQRPSPIVSVVVTALVLPLLAVPLAAVITLVLRTVFTILGIKMIARGGLAAIIRNVGVLGRAYSLGVMTVACWEWAETVFDLTVPQPVSLLSQSASPALTAVSAVSDSSAPALTHYFALSELLELSPEAQAVIFNEQRYTPGLWTVFSRSALVNLGRDWKTFERRGAPPPLPASTLATAAAAPQSTPVPAEIQNVTPAKLIRRPILSSSVNGYGSASGRSRISDVLRSDGDLAGAVDEIPLPDLFKSVSANVMVPQQVRKVEQEVKREAEKVKGFFSGGWCTSWGGFVRFVLGGPRVRRAVVAVGGDEVLHWWTRERIDRRAEMALPNRELDVLYVKALSRLTCASLADDKFGVVQRDIPRILEAFCTFLDGIEAYEMELKAFIDGAAEGAEREMIRVEAGKARDIVDALSHALKEGIAGITQTFGEKLTAFKFPPKTAKKLQGFVDLL